MSDAKVTFETLALEPAQPGQETRFSFQCPKSKMTRCSGLLIRGRSDIPWDPQNGNGGQAQWGWNGSREAPTFTPSINCSGCWHGYIEGGRCLNTSKQEEPQL